MCVKTVCICRLIIGITDHKNVDWFQIIRKIKFFTQNIRLEIAYPHSTKTKFCSLQHHVVRQDGSVNVTRLRGKLEALGVPGMIRTRRGMGYQYDGA